MDVEIITIGDEIITGHRVDTNTSFIARHLARAGLRVRYQSSVGDTLDAMEEAFRLALKRAHIVITTGGLGPTDDDVTKKAIVKVFKRNLIFHEDVLTDIKQRYAKRGIEMPAINQNQALLPQGATIFPNKYGSAVGLCIAEEGRVFVALPGVPYEMKQILVDEVLPYLQNLNAGRPVAAVSLKTTGIVESKLAELIAPGLKLEPGVTLSYLPAPSSIELRVIGTSESIEDAHDKVQNIVRYLETSVGKYVFGHDEDTLEAVVGQILADNDRTVSVAESCTGGLLGARLTAVSGSSRYFLGGIVAYSNDVKMNQLDVDPAVLEEHGAVSEECAKAMAAGCRTRFDSDYALSITGIAGPEGGTDEKPIGVTFIGLSSRHTTYARKFSLGTLRETVRERAVYAALEMLRRDILDIA